MVRLIVTLQLNLLFDAIKPVTHALKRFSICQIEDYYNAICLANLGRDDAVKAFLTGCIPKLHATLCSVAHLILVLDEVDADRGEKVRVELLFRVHVEERGLSDLGRPNHEQLEPWLFATLPRRI